MFTASTSRLALATALIAAAPPAFAAHIIGGELYYDRLEGTQYQITLTLYRDCAGTGAAFDAIGYITVFTGSGSLLQVLQVPYSGSTFIPVVLDDPCLNFPPDLCIETTSYITTVTLPPSATGYHLSYQRCCRQPSILNLFNAVDAGITCTARIPPMPEDNNSSPRFNSLPPVALCQDQTLVFDHSATDPDGDSLVYALASPYNGASQLVPYPTQSAPPPYAPVAWSSGYSENDQIDSQPPMAIDAVTGSLSVHPTSIGNYAIAVGVKEYRNGLLLSETIRDFLFSVVPCNAVVDAIIAPQTEFCTGNLTVNLTNNSAGGQLWQWNFGDPSTLADTSSAEDPSWTFPAPGTYTVSLVANPGFPCTDTALATFELYPTPVPSFLLPGPACGALDTVLTALGDFGPDAFIHWELGPNATPTQANGPQVAVVFGPNGPHPVSLAVQDHGCTGFFNATVITSPLPLPAFTLSPDPPQPMGATVLATDISSANGTTVASTFWLLDSSVVQQGGSTWTWGNAAPGEHVLTLTYVTADGCTASVSMPYAIIPEDVVIPNVFTPNGDGENDFFTITNAQYFNNSLRVYNRWGLVVLDAVNYRNQWRGTELPDGTYYYVFRLDDGREYAGHFSLLR
ncbi:MAG: gliding motility-associated C-terminal domain-containing protein [Flavobacteriales bacterium]|nr:gliding motility-associated C-terminal domain-containing protein [Flavobacteriales bacterium]